MNVGYQLTSKYLTEAKEMVPVGKKHDCFKNYKPFCTEHNKGTGPGFSPLCFDLNENIQLDKNTLSFTKSESNVFF